MFCDNRPYLYTPLGVLSLLATGLYTASWQFDPCCKYQVLLTHLLYIFYKK